MKAIILDIADHEEAKDRGLIIQPPRGFTLLILYVPGIEDEGGLISKLDNKIGRFLHGDEYYEQFKQTSILVPSSQATKLNKKDEVDIDISINKLRVIE
ncbi:MAG: hypothetical protein ACOC53_05420 [Candidatus Saliniplasma sp.]